MAEELSAVELEDAQMIPATTVTVEPDASLGSAVPEGGLTAKFAKPGTAAAADSQMTSGQELAGIYGRVPSVPTSGGWRNAFCDCCDCPMCCVAWCFPYIIWAQLHYHLNGGREHEKDGFCCHRGARGYYIIIIGFALLEFLAVMGEGSDLEGGTGAGLFYSAIAMLGATASVMVMLTLVRRLKLLYNINKEDERFSMAAFHAQNPTCREKCCCGGCDEACCDVHKSIWCWCCFTYQMGNHVFDYKNTTRYITYEPVPTSFEVV